MAEAPIPILEMKNVGKTYSQNGRSIEALRGANLRVKKGEFICLIGASGCGKSTLLRMAAGFEAATHGDNLMWGMPISGPGPSRGMVFQDYGLFPWLNVRDNIGFGPRSRGRTRAEIRETSDRFIELVGLQNFADVYPHQLSGGMKQRVAIARVLANDPAYQESAAGAKYEDAEPHRTDSKRRLVHQWRPNLGWKVSTRRRASPRIARHVPPGR